jgi:hypothetical protein
MKHDGRIPSEISILLDVELHEGRYSKGDTVNPVLYGRLPPKEAH